MTTPRTLPGFLAFSLAAVTLLASCGHHHPPMMENKPRTPKKEPGRKSPTGLRSPPGQ